MSNKMNSGDPFSRNPFSKLTPDLIGEVASKLHANDVSANLKLASKTFACLRANYNRLLLRAQPVLSDVCFQLDKELPLESLLIAEQPWPGPAFVAHWGRPEPWRTLTRRDRHRLLCLDYLGCSAEHLLRGSVLPALERLVIYSGDDRANDELNGWDPFGELAEADGKEGKQKNWRRRNLHFPPTPPDYFVFPRLRELTIDEPNFMYGSRKWRDWSAFKELVSLESLHWAGAQEDWLKGDITDALPALSGLRRLALHSAWGCPKGLSELKQLESLEATILCVHDYWDDLSKWDLRGLESLRTAAFAGNLIKRMGLPLMDSSLTALEHIRLLRMKTTLRVLDPALAALELEPLKEAVAERLAAGTSTAALFDPLQDVFEAFVAPCAVLPNIRTVQLVNVYFDLKGLNFVLEDFYQGPLSLNPRPRGYFECTASGRRWRARLWVWGKGGKRYEVKRPREVGTESKKSMWEAHDFEVVFEAV